MSFITDAGTTLSEADIAFIESNPTQFPSLAAEFGFITKAESQKLLNNEAVSSFLTVEVDAPMNIERLIEKSIPLMMIVVGVCMVVTVVGWMGMCNDRSHLHEDEDRRFSAECSRAGGVPEEVGTDHFACLSPVVQTPRTVIPVPTFHVGVKP